MATTGTRGDGHATTSFELACGHRTSSTTRDSLRGDPRGNPGGVRPARLPICCSQAHAAAQPRLIPTDLKCLDAAHGEQQITAGRLAEITGLSTSATTAALDRLERRGFIRRIRDDHDRRRVFVVSTGQHEAETARLFSPLATATAAIMDHYDDEQLALIADFLERLNAANERLITQQSINPGPLQESTS
jgi:DNA-binding MarR family transcriptional regulator